MGGQKNVTYNLQPRKALGPKVSKIPDFGKSIKHAFSQWPIREHSVGEGNIRLVFPDRTQMFLDRPVADQGTFRMKYYRI